MNMQIRDSPSTVCHPEIIRPLERDDVVVFDSSTYFGVARLSGTKSQPSFFVNGQHFSLVLLPFYPVLISSFGYQTWSDSQTIVVKATR